MRPPKTIILLSLFLATAVQAAIVHVPTDQPTVQAGIDAAVVGDTVQLAPGTYLENVTINKAVTLIGETQNSTVISAGGSGDCVLITANGVVVRNLCLQGGGPSQPWEGAWDAGIKIFEADSCLIERCLFIDNGAAGLALSASADNTITECAFVLNQAGIYFYENPEGPYRNNSSNRILGNWIKNNYTGILFEHGMAVFHSANYIAWNRIEENLTGMSMIMSEQNHIQYNSFKSNINWALTLTACIAGGEGNRFDHNCFIGNNGGGVQAADHGGYVDYWYDTLNLEGNHWSDYSGSDGDGDGIGDSPYDIDGGESADLYPLMSYDDADADGAPDMVDNCPGLYNPSQQDSDYDFIGFACDDCTDYDGDGYGDPDMPNNTCPDDNCYANYNPLQEDTDGDGLGDSCDFEQFRVETIWTDCLGLVTANDGNLGQICDGGHNLDYVLYGDDCDPGADVYLCDASPFVLRIDDGDTLLDQAIHDTHTYRRVGWGRPYEGVVSQADFDRYRSGTITTGDYAIGLEQWLWAPKQTDTCDFIIHALRLYSFDGETHTGVSVGLGIDWDIPSDEGAYNESGFDAPHNLIYQQGVELDGQGCQSNATRFGGQALLDIYANDTCATSLGGQPYSAYSASTPNYLWPQGGFVAAELDSMIHQPGYHIKYDTVDLHTVMTYFVDLTLAPGDTITVYTALVSVRNGSLPHLLNNVTEAKRWYAGHVADLCICCEGLRGNVDFGASETIDISDLVYAVDYMFADGPPPPCSTEADINGDGTVDIADLVCLVDYMFVQPPECQPAACP